jgi:hypothetical protein
MVDWSRVAAVWKQLLDVGEGFRLGIHQRVGFQEHVGGGHALLDLQQAATDVTAQATLRATAPARVRRQHEISGGTPQALGYLHVLERTWISRQEEEFPGREAQPPLRSITPPVPVQQPRRRLKMARGAERGGRARGSQAGLNVPFERAVVAGVLEVIRHGRRTGARRRA